MLNIKASRPETRIDDTLQPVVAQRCASGRMPDIGAREARHSRHAAETDILLEPQVVVHRDLTLFRCARFITWRLRQLFLGECQRGPRHLWECWACLGYGLVPVLTLKKPCSTFVRLVRRTTNTVTKPLCLFTSISRNTHTHTHIYIFIISSQRPKTVGVDYSCIEYMRNII